MMQRCGLTGPRASWMISRNLAPGVQAPIGLSQANGAGVGHHLDMGTPAGYSTGQWSKGEAIR
jgi:hypothetical protein